MADSNEQMPDGVASGAALWHGRFASGPSRDLMDYTESIGFDRRLWADDIDGSKAHVAMLASVGLMSAEDAAKVSAALDDVRAEMSSGTFVFAETDEDIHTAIERRVTQIAGEPGGRLHTGRSRNDQVATALRLWSRREMGTVAGALIALVDVLAARADEADAAVPPLALPGYTHLQRAQPVLLPTISARMPGLSCATWTALPMLSPAPTCPRSGRVPSRVPRCRWTRHIRRARWASQRRSRTRSTP